MYMRKRRLSSSRAGKGAEQGEIVLLCNVSSSSFSFFKLVLESEDFLKGAHLHLLPTIKVFLAPRGSIHQTVVNFPFSLSAHPRSTRNTKKLKSDVKIFPPAQAKRFHSVIYLPAAHTTLVPDAPRKFNKLLRTFSSSPSLFGCSLDAGARESETEDTRSDKKHTPAHALILPYFPSPHKPRFTTPSRRPLAALAAFTTFRWGFLSSLAIYTPSYGFSSIFLASTRKFISRREQQQDEARRARDLKLLAP